MAHYFDEFRGKRVLITGCTGFKGSWLSEWLLRLGAEVYGVALAPDRTNAHFDLLGLSQRMSYREGDVRDYDGLLKDFQEFKPEVVFHLAAQALVRRSYELPVDTFSTNVMGSVNVLECARRTVETRALVYVTSDKCYHNKEWTWGYRENDELGINHRFCFANGIEVKLMELAVATGLRAIVAKTRAARKQFHRLRLADHAVVHVGTANRRRALGAQHHIVAALVGEAVHFFLNNVGLLANAAHEEARVLENRGFDPRKLVVAGNGFERVVNPAPVVCLGRQNVAHAAQRFNGASRFHHRRRNLKGRRNLFRFWFHNVFGFLFHFFLNRFLHTLQVIGGL